MSDISDPRYRIPGIPNSVNFAQWTRENEPAEPPKHAIGDVVVFTFVTTVSAINQDCDGTPLYKLGVIGGGWSSDNVRAATDEEKRSAGYRTE